MTFQYTLVKIHNSEPMTQDEFIALTGAALEHSRENLTGEIVNELPVEDEISVPANAKSINCSW